MNDYAGPERRAYRKQYDDSPVSWRDMVEYVDRTATEIHTSRAEAVTNFAKSVEKIEKRMDKHDEYHRAGFGRNTSVLSLVVALGALIVMAISLASSVAH